MKIALCGDCLLSKRISYGWYDKIKSILESYECRFANLETVISDEKGYPALFPGGGYSCIGFKELLDIKSLGFNLLNAANNHAMDYSHNGLLSTIENLKKADIPFAGIGKNLSEASRPAFFESSEGRIALIGITSSFHDSYAASPQNSDMQGTPGVNPLKHKEIYELSDTDFELLERIIGKTGINAYHKQAQKEGYLNESKDLNIGPYRFAHGHTGVFHSTPDEDDLLRTLKTIRDARHYADFIIVSVHSHQFANGNKQIEPEFISTFCQRCIDSGANVIVCTGPHCLRGIEIYNKGLILHGLGNFIFQHEEQDVLPELFYLKYGTTRDGSSGVGDIYNKRSKNGTVGLCNEPKAWYSVIVGLEWNSKSAKCALYPIELFCQESKGLKGLPHLSCKREILEEVAKLSAPYGTKISISEDCIGHIAFDI